MQKININNKSGMTLAIVMMIMLVMFLIGGTFLRVSAYQSKQAAQLDKGIQAHYLARAGAESVLQAWLDADSTHKPSGTIDTVYLTSAGTFGQNGVDSEGSFDVLITQSGTKTLITSTGKVLNSEKKVTVTIDTIQTVLPGENPAYVTGEGFYDFTSGQIVRGVDWPPNNHTTRGIVKNEAKNGKGIKHPNQNALPATQTYEKMLFSSTVQVLHNRINLKSNVILFKEPVDYSSNNNSKGSLNLFVYGADHGATPISNPAESGNWGIVIFNGVGYYFKDLVDPGVVITKESDIQLRIDEHSMYLITDPNILKLYMDLVLPSTITVTSYSILWSK